PQLEMTALADQPDLLLEFGKAAQRRGDQHPPGGVESLFLGEADEQALELRRLHVEAGRGEHLVADRNPGRDGIDQQTAVRMRGQHDLSILDGERIPMAGRNRKTPLRIEIERCGSLEHSPPFRHAGEASQMTPRPTFFHLPPLYWKGFLRSRRHPGDFLCYTMTY